MKKIVTQEDLDLNPEFVEQGVKIGDEIELPEPGEEDTKEDGPGNDQPPGSQPGKP